MEVLKDYPKEFAKLFQPSFNFLTNININFFFKREDFIKKNWRFLYIVPCLVIHYGTLGFNVGKMAAKGEIFEIAFILGPFLISTQAILKFIVLLPKTSLLKTIIQDLGDLWKTSGLNGVERNVRDGLLKKVNFCNGLSYWVSLIGTFQYLITPLWEILVRIFILKQESELLLPIGCSYPFDTSSNWVIYGILYIFQTYCMFLCVFIYIGAELIMITLCAIIGVEFTLFCENMLSVKPKPKNRTNHNSSDAVNTEIFTINDVVKRHQKLCFLAAQLDDAFNQMIFVNLMFVGLTTCFFSYAAQFSPGPIYTIINYVAVCSSLLNVLYLCYYGEILTGESLRVGDMAYHNLWYKGDTSYKKAIYIIIIRSQKRCCLTSMKYSPVTLNMFTKVISSTWSYLSLMNSVYEEEN